MKILMLEDNERLANSISGLLEDRGHDVTVCADVATARACYEHRGPDWFDVLLCDYELPDGTGLDFLACVRGSDRARTILWSGLDRRRELAASGQTVDAFLTKNVDALLVALDALDLVADRCR